MKKGQLSMDLLLAILAAVLFLLLMQAYMEGFNVTIQESKTKNALDSVLLDVYSAVGSVKAYGAEMEYTIPNSIECEVDIGNSTNADITVTDLDSGTDRKYTDLDLSKIKIEPSTGTIYCGDTITITKE
ncbi:MAG: hypothetical protein CL944_02795 [Candidatus Diapherotrites archaeon]|uniref:Class III signal peptide-containing protein n=1 Tax=Candidatus Iainarchaeum sp. TaxID=3101447 RepID=A0A2D6LQC7_9ARCH|nr:hypothetical protein [Candidatus Diapherotrites archaeon]|tara:strand:- start:13 stop:399 length:387 start_codon:yes stop_codon:yes gene_type:complete